MRTIPTSQQRKKVKQQLQRQFALEIGSLYQITDYFTVHSLLTYRNQGF